MGGYLYLRLDDEIRRQVEKRLADHYAQLRVHVGRARFEPDHGIAVYDVALLDPQPSGDAVPLITIDELHLIGKLRLEELVSDRLKIDEIVVRRARLRAHRQPDQKWNIAALTPFPDLSDSSPLIRVEDATVVVEDATRGKSIAQTVQGIDLTLTPVELNDAPTAGAMTRFRVAGTASGLPAREMRVEGEIDTTSGDFDLSMNVTGLEVTSQLIAALRGIGAPELNGADLFGRADIAVHVRQVDRVPNWSAAVKLDRGRIAHPRLPEPLSDVAFTCQANSSRLHVERLTCRCGPANIVVAAERAGWATSAPLAVAARIVDLPLDERWPAILPESFARVWQRFQPAGLVDAEVRATFDGQQWRPQLSANCRGLSLTDAAKFPYRLAQTTGRIEYTPSQTDAPDKLRLDLTGVGGGRPIRVEAELTHLAPSESAGVATEAGLATRSAAELPTNRTASYRDGVSTGQLPSPRRHPLGWVQVSGADIPLHEPLIAALPEKAGRLVRSLRAQGSIDFQFRAEWSQLSQGRAEVTQDIRLKNCAILYERFPYPLDQVEGLVTQRGGIWTLHDVQGRGWNDSTAVVCRGQTSPRGEDFHTDITLQATNVALDDNLKLALPTAAQQAWEEFHPLGRVDFDVHAICEPGQSEPRIDAVIKPRDRSVSIEPAKFPYRIEQIEGVAAYHDGQVELRNVIGRHDRAIYSVAAGAWQPAPGGWQLTLTGVNADRLTPHRDLVVALPPRWQRLIERLQPSGTFGIYNSNMNFAKSRNSDHIAASWDANLDCHQAKLSGELPLQGLTGGVRLVGRHDGESSFSTGELALDSLVWKDIQFTNVRGPLWVDPARSLLGETAAQKQSQPPRRITADAYGGSLAANIEVQHDPAVSYKLDLALGGASLARFANERLGGPKNMNGTVSGRLSVSGAGLSTQTLQGSGDLSVVDANIYELPFLVAMLKVLKVRTPDTTAFNRCDMQFKIQGEGLQFEKLNLLGDAVSLYGKGESGFDRRLDLVFYTLPEPANLPIPLWKTIAGQVSQQALQLRVVGTWEKAEVQPQTLPAFNQVLEQIQASAATMAPSPATRDATLPAR
ncbi:MAG: AsmA-like C-terminal region-containing protein [Pirellulales bacterium]